MKEFTVQEFSNIMGISRQYLFTILKKHDSPPQVVTVVGKRRHVTIPEREGILWLRQRDPERAEAYVNVNLWLAADQRHLNERSQ